MQEYPFIKRLIDEGYEVSFNDTGMRKKLVIVCDEGGHLIMDGEIGIICQRPF